jgi:hypothetical protein
MIMCAPKGDGAGVSKLRHQRNTADDGGGPREIPLHPTPWNQLTTVAYLELVHNCTLFERSGPDLGMRNLDPQHSDHFARR